MAFKIDRFDTSVFNPTPNIVIMNNIGGQRNIGNIRNIRDENITRKMVSFVFSRNLLTTLTEYADNFRKRHKLMTFKIPVYSHNGR